MTTDPILDWKAYEYRFQEKTPDWYWAVGIIAISVAVTAVLFHNVLFAILVILGAFTLSLYAHRKPDRILCRLTDREIRFGKNIYTYSNLDSFWIESDYGDPRIVIKSKKTVMPYIVIPIGSEIAPNNVRHFLSRYLREEEHHEPLSHKIMEFLGF
jgi:hypothetical protein